MDEGRPCGAPGRRRRRCRCLRADGPARSEHLPVAVSSPRYALGLVFTVATLVPLVIGATRVRARLVPELSGERARLAEVVVVLAGYVLVGEALGTVRLFRTGFLVAGCIVVGLGLAWARRSSPRPSPIRAHHTPAADTGTTGVSLVPVH